jgi:carbon-monoxide dehydrogenase medium subunit
VKSFDYAAPDSVAEAALLLASRPAARALAGGTDLLVQMRGGRLTPDPVVDVKRIPELNQLLIEADGSLTLGAAVPCYRIYRSREVSRRFAALAEVAALIGGTQIQGRASIGGNLCNAAPSADSAPLLIAMRATCRIAGTAGVREIPVEDFFVGPGRNVLTPGELLVSVRLPAPQVGSGAKYLRFTPRNEMDIAVVGAGVAVVVEHGKLRSVRVSLAAVAPVPLYVADAGAAVEGELVGSDAFRRAGEISRTAAQPITDMRGDASYRRHLCAVLTERALEAAVRRATENGHHHG